MKIRDDKQPLDIYFAQASENYYITLMNLTTIRSLHFLEKHFT